MWAGAREGVQGRHAGVPPGAPRGQGGAPEGEADGDDNDLQLDDLTPRSARGSLATTSTNVTLTSRLLQGLPRGPSPRPHPYPYPYPHPYSRPHSRPRPRPGAGLYAFPFHSFQGAFPGLACRRGAGVAGGRLHASPHPKLPPPPHRLRVLPPHASALHPGRLETASLLLRFTTEIAAQQKPASKVRVTFYESSKPLVVTSPEPSDFDQYSPQDFLMASPLTDAHMPGFDRQLSSDSGRDNPFRPDGDISREADEIVQLIKSGRPLQQPPEDALDGTAPLEASSPAHEKEVAAEPLLPRPDAHRQPQALHATPANAARTHSPTADGASKGGATSPSAGAASPSKAGANGSAAPEASMPGTVEVTHATVTPTDPAHVEHVVIRKKSKCNCCVIQ